LHGKWPEKPISGTETFDLRMLDIVILEVKDFLWINLRVASSHFFLEKTCFDMISSELFS
jgi:hypothetical protein